jgi:hypothetical protein
MGQPLSDGVGRTCTRYQNVPFAGQQQIDNRQPPPIYALDERSDGLRISLNHLLRP